MSITFRYKSVKRPDGTSVKTPSIPVTFMGKESFDNVALVDSGADISAMPKDIAEILGLKLSAKITHAYGIGGKARSVETTVAIVVKKGHENYRFNIPVKVILDDYDFPILLGRAGFFDKFIITFDEQEQKISLKRKYKR